MWFCMSVCLGVTAVAQHTFRGAMEANQGHPPTNLDEPRAVRQTPPPLAAGPELEMHQTTAQHEPTGFTLTAANGQVFGPFRLEEGATVGSALNPYKLKRLGDPAAAAFTLVSSLGGTPFGPFTAQTGEQITLGQNVLTLQRLPTALNVSLHHEKAVGTAAIVALGPLNEACRRDLYALRESLVQRANLLADELAPTEIQGIPTIITRHGTRFEPVFKRSLRDQQTALTAADKAAAALIDRFVRKNLPLRVPPDSDTVRRFRPLPPGQWLLCAMTLVRPPSQQAPAPTTTAYWWAPFELEADTAATLALTAENACDWRDLFLFPH